MEARCDVRYRRGVRPVGRVRRLQVDGATSGAGCTRQPMRRDAAASKRRGDARVAREWRLQASGTAGRSEGDRQGSPLVSGGTKKHAVGAVRGRADVFARQFHVARRRPFDDAMACLCGASGQGRAQRHGRPTRRPCKDGEGYGHAGSARRGAAVQWPCARAGGACLADACQCST